MNELIIPNEERPDIAHLNNIDLSDIEELAIRAALYQKSFYDFFLDAWRVMNKGKPFKNAFFVKVICDHCQAVIEGRVRNLIITIPPRHAKSWIVSVFLPAWCWLVKPHLEIISASYKETLATRDCVRSRRLMQSEWYQALLPFCDGIDNWTFTSDQNAKVRYENTAGGHRISTSVSGSITGDGGSLFLVDDALAASDGQSDAALLNLEDWWFETAPMRINDPSTDSFILVQQRLNVRDLIGLVYSSEGSVDENDIHHLPDDWDVINLPMRCEHNHPYPTRSSLGFVDPRKEGELLSPLRYPEHEVAKLEKKMGIFGAAGQLQQRPTPRSGGIIEEQWWLPIDKATFFKDWKTHYIMQSWDTAYTDKDRQKNNTSKSACTTWAVCSKKDRPEMKYAVLFDVFAERLAFHCLRDKAIELNDKFEPNLIIIEGQSAGKPIIDEFHRSGVYPFDFNPRGYGDKEARAWVVSPMFQQGIVHYLDWRTCNREAIKACSAFPQGEGKDIVDTITQVLLYVREYDILLKGDPDFDKFEEKVVEGAVEIEDDFDAPDYSSA